MSGCRWQVAYNENTKEHIVVAEVQFSRCRDMKDMHIHIHSLICIYVQVWYNLFRIANSLLYINSKYVYAVQEIILHKRSDKQIHHTAMSPSKQVLLPSLESQLIKRWHFFHGLNASCGFFHREDRIGMPQKSVF